MFCAILPLLLFPSPQEDPLQEDPLQELLRLRRAGDWTALAEAAGEAHAQADPTSDLWYISAADLCRASYWIHDDPSLQTLEEAGEELLDHPPAEAGADKIWANQVVRSYLALHALNRGEAARALDLVDPFLTVRPGSIPAELWGEANLIAVQALFELERGAQAGNLLFKVAMRIPLTRVGAQAQAWLVALHGEYFGRYRENEEHAALRVACLAAGEEARAKLIESLPELRLELESILIGYADRPDELLDQDWCIALVNWRDPRPPILVVFTEELEVDAIDPALRLARELFEAALELRLGRSGEDLPPWLLRGLAWRWSGFFPEAERQALLNRFLRHSCDSPLTSCILDRKQYWSRWPVPLDPSEAALRVASLPHPERFMDLLINGDPLGEAFETANGESLDNFIARADRELHQRLKRRLEKARPALHTLFASSPATGPGTQAAEEVLAETSIPWLRSAARWRLARSLADRGLPREALAAWDAILADRRHHPILVPAALHERARALLDLESWSEARQALMLLGRTTRRIPIRNWAAQALKAIEKR